jgi:hypothetical protein
MQHLEKLWRMLENESLVNNETRFKKIVNDPTFDNAIIINESKFIVYRY